jgi:formylglycine-generating enzyme required for sulfatase activity
MPPLPRTASPPASSPPASSPPPALAEGRPEAAPAGPNPPRRPPVELPSWAFAAGRDAVGDFALFDLNGVIQRMRWCPPGRFVMGAPEAEPGRRGHEGPAHAVALSRGYWLADTPVTVALFYAVTGRLDGRDLLADDADPLGDADPEAEAPPSRVPAAAPQGPATDPDPAGPAPAPSGPALDVQGEVLDEPDPDPADPDPADAEPGDPEAADAEQEDPEADDEDLAFEDDDPDFDLDAFAFGYDLEAVARDAQPVEGLSWQEAVAFAARLDVALRARAAEEGLPADGLVFRLPTEAEWEYACRAGTAAPTDPGGPEPVLRDERAWLATYPDNATPPVALRSPNAWGFYDTVGLVWEWCADAVSPLEPYPGGPRADPFLSGGPCRALRGGAWPRPLSEHRAAGRRAEPPDAHPRFAGLRLVCGPPLSAE